MSMAAGVGGRKKKKGNSTGGAGGGISDTKLLRITCLAIYQQESFVFLYEFFYNDSQISTTTMTVQ